MAYQPLGPISALGAFGPRADMGPLRLICHAMWILACIILCVLLTDLIVISFPQAEVCMLTTTL
jgi:hypothetical protein